MRTDNFLVCGLLVDVNIKVLEPYAMPVVSSTQNWFVHLFLLFVYNPQFASILDQETIQQQNLRAEKDPSQQK